MAHLYLKVQEIKDEQIEHANWFGVQEPQVKDSFMCLHSKCMRSKNWIRQGFQRQPAAAASRAATWVG